MIRSVYLVPAQHLAVVAALAISVGACEKSTASVAGADSRDKVLSVWKEKGLTPLALSPAHVAVGKDCQSGTVSGLDVLLCVFASADEAKAAEDAGLAWVGDTSGASQAKGSVLIVVADRKKADPSGRTINTMLK